MDREKKFKQLRGLTAYKNISDEDLWKEVDKKVNEDNILENSFCVNDEERKFAKELLSKYLTRSFENPSERDDLRQLIDQEILAERIKILMKNEYDKENPVIVQQRVEQLDVVLNRIGEIKEKLHLTTDVEQKEMLDEWEKLKKKALAHYKENAGCNIVKCSYCQRLSKIMKDMTGFHTEPLPLFKRTLLYNKELYELIEKNIITKEKVASILGTSIDYVEYIYNNTYLNDK